MDFLEREIKSRERSQTFRETCKAVPEERPSCRTTAAALHTKSQRPPWVATTSQVECGICSKPHMTASCWVITRTRSVADRKIKFASAGLCFCCLARGHIAKGCMERCSHCKGRHHVLNSTEQEGIVRVMRFTRVPFGNRSCPFLLNATVQHHLTQFPPTKVVEELRANMYVDDWLTGADSDEEACNMLTEATDVMDKASMSLAKWGSNSEAVSDKSYREFEDKYHDSDSLQVLGLKWSVTTDSFGFEGIDLPSGLCVTKRVVLSFIARLFDPLGFLNPYLMVAKCLFQDLWRQGIEWDQPVPDEIQQQFSRWVGGWQSLKGWQIPRSYTGSQWQDISFIELHAFGDASERGYGACVYLHATMIDGTSSTSLVMSRAKVAPLKKPTLPRLELLGALLSARLLVFVQQTLKLPPEVPYRCWTDSRVVLAWVHSEPGRWTTYVSNRVAEIQEKTNPSRRNHCAGRENPADLVTRGIFAEELVKSKVWLQGPEFLVCGESNSQECESSPQKSDVKNEEDSQCLMEAKDRVQTTLVAVKVNDSILEIKRWSTLTKAIHVMAWISRCILNLKAPKPERKFGELTLSEMSTAKLLLFSIVHEQEYSEEISSLKQGRHVSSSSKSSIVRLGPFLGDDGLLRVKGRLQFSDLAYEVKHPIIMPKSHMSLLLVQFQHTLLKYAGVNTMIASLRGQFWIIGVRRLAKQVKKECISCQIKDRMYRLLEKYGPPLPELRVKQAPPFTVTGMDHLGPLYCCDAPRRTFYILLFTCAVIRAVHLELVNSLSCEDTVLALHRFAARRGLPSVIYSDNAKAFTAAQSRMLNQFGYTCPQWRCIAPRSPWWGGWWERLVRLVKVALKKSRPHFHRHLSVLLII